MAGQIKISGTDIIVVGFDQGGRLKALERMKEIASPGYFFKNTADNLAGEIQRSLCQTNCFCKKQWRQYSSATVKFGSCLKIGGIAANWKSARGACQRMGNGRGHLASEFDISKHNFIAWMFKDDYRTKQPYMYHIGLSYDEEKKGYFWEQPYGKKVPVSSENW
ncbi:hypothetical protein OESDEN_04090 [Oesophagostomum dentatum]|uniref:C-type lectin domain-containing protein n=1 Tax=Oesophagostomum dentatum TaxID=61180 RepID=A0A0B1TJE6_OESDE|nr:hypothetical protein OESDEN_04090 [Oesophagostomum dentatum]